MKKGAQSYTVRDYLKDRDQFENTMKKIKAIGYDSVQNGTPNFMTDSEVKSLLDEIGLIPCSSYGSFEAMNEKEEAVKKAADTAKAYNTKYIGIGTIPDMHRDSEKGYKKFAADLNKVGAELKKEGCGILYHNHALEFYSLGGGRHGMDIILGETDPSCVFFSLDTHWLASGGVDPSDWIYKVKGRMPIVHFKDYAIGSGAQTVEGVCKLYAEVGEGNLDWKKIVAACHETGVEYAIVEQDTCKGDPFESLEISFQNMVSFGV